MITKEVAEKILEKPTLVQGLNKYKYIMSKVNTVDVSKDMEFQRMYRDFYAMSKRYYSDEFATDYFEIMEKFKEESEVSFSKAFEKVRAIQDTFEVSFATKIVHTFNDSMPIWDRVVAVEHFGFRVPSYKVKRVEKMEAKYEEYIKTFYEYLESEEGQMLIGMFDEKFPNSGISDVKKLDFIFWQDR